MIFCFHQWITRGRTMIKGKGITQYRCVKCGKLKNKMW